MSNKTFSTAARLYSVEDAAKLCGSVSPSTIRKHIARGTVHITRIGRRVFVTSEEIERIRREGLPSLRNETNERIPFEAEPNTTKEIEPCLNKQS